ncbi:MAG: acyltransferase [Gemmataceae bacterium]
MNLRSLVRDGVVYATVVLLVPVWLPAWVERRVSRGETWFVFGAELVSLVPGKPGIFVRRAYYRMTLNSCASDASIGFGTLFAHPDAEVHPGVYVGSRCTFGKAVLGRDATVGSNVDVLSGRRQHGFGRFDVAVQRQGGEFQQIQIGPNCWLGNSAVVMADVGEASVIGAGSVVVKPIPPRSVAVGNPAVVLRSIAA